MPNYKLTYFPGRGVAEVARQLLHLGDPSFEDVRVAQDKWPELKPRTPFGQMPVLSVDGKELAQSGAITRYLARQFGYAGKNDWEAAQVDALHEQIRDFKTEVRVAFATLAGFLPGDKDKLLKETAIPARDKFAPLLEKYLVANKSGWLVGDGLTYADLLLAEVTETWIGFDADFFKANPAILEHRKRVHNYPKLKDWIEKRPKTAY